MLNHATEHASIVKTRVTTTTTYDSGAESVDRAPRRERSSGQFMPGDALGRYEVLFPLATGGMATVYAARLLGEAGFQKAVALKVMLPHLARDERFVAMFMDEAALAARVQSAHVVQVIELARHDAHTLFIAMDLVVGVSLWQVFADATRRGVSLPLPVLCTLLIQAAHGLHDAHEACAPNGERLGIVHRDVSPHNVLVGVDGRARITDFGIARAIERIGATQTGELKGKLPYFSPEQVRCVELDARSDVFSLGIVAFEMVSGQRLFDAPNPLATAQAVAAKEVPRLDAVRADVPREVADVIAHALERDPERRLSSADAFARGLRAACEASTGLAEPREVSNALRALCGTSIETVERALAAAMATPTAKHRASSLKRSERSQRGLIVGVLATLLLGGLAALLWLPRKAPSELVQAARQAPAESAAQANSRAPEAVPSAAPLITPAPSQLSPNEPTVQAPEARPAASAKRKVRRARAPTRDAQSAPSPPAPRDTLLRKIEEFDHERVR